MKNSLYFAAYYLAAIDSILPKDVKNFILSVMFGAADGDYVAVEAKEAFLRSEISSGHKIPARAVKLLWREFRAVPLDEEGRILSEFYIWPAGTHSFRIQSWFDSAIDGGIDALIEQQKKDEYVDEPSEEARRLADFFDNLSPSMCQEGGGSCYLGAYRDALEAVKEYLDAAAPYSKGYETIKSAYDSATDPDEIDCCTSCATSCYEWLEEAVNEAVSR